MAIFWWLIDEMPLVVADCVTPNRSRFAILSEAKDLIALSA